MCRAANKKCFSLLRNYGRTLSVRSLQDRWKNNISRLEHHRASSRMHSLITTTCQGVHSILGGRHRPAIFATIPARSGHIYKKSTDHVAVEHLVFCRVFCCVLRLGNHAKITLENIQNATKTKAYQTFLFYFTVVNACYFLNLISTISQTLI